MNHLPNNTKSAKTDSRTKKTNKLLTLPNSLNTYSLHHVSYSLNPKVLHNATSTSQPPKCNTQPQTSSHNVRHFSASCSNTTATRHPTTSDTYGVKIFLSIPVRYSKQNRSRS